MKKLEFARITSISMLSIATALSLVSCGKDETKDETRTVPTVSALSGTATTSATQLAGTGKLIVTTPTAGVTSANHYSMTFTLADGGSLTFFANATDQLASGYQLKLTRSGNTLQVAASIGNGAPVDLTSRFSGFSAASTMTLLLDVHNDEDPAHVVAWKDTAVETNEIYNSEVEDGEGGPASPGAGSGIYWGFELDNATVTAASITSPKEAH